MSQSIQVNGQTINYPETGDTNWGDNATNFAIQTSSAFGKLGLDSGTSVDIPQTLDVTGNTTLDANLSVGGNLTVNGSTTLGDTSGDSLTINSNGVSIPNGLNFDSNTLVVDATNNRVGIGTTTPLAQLSILGAGQTTGNLSTSTNLGGTLYVRDSGGSGGNGGAVLFGAFQGSFAAIKGLITDGSNNTLGELSFSTRTTNSDSTLTTKLKLGASGQISAVVPGGSTLYPGYLCRAWAKINQTGTQSISSSGNISSLVDGGNGITTVNFTNPMPDSEYSVFLCSNGNTSENWSYVSDTYSTGSVRCIIGFTTAGTTTFSLADRPIVTIGIFR